MPSTPLISCSSGAATVSAMTFGLAPGYARAHDDGRRDDLRVLAQRQLRERDAADDDQDEAERTAAKIGRSMKKVENFMARSGRRSGCCR